MWFVSFVFLCFRLYSFQYFFICRFMSFLLLLLPHRLMGLSMGLHVCLNGCCCCRCLLVLCLGFRSGLLFLVYTLGLLWCAGVVPFASCCAVLYVCLPASLAAAGLLLSGLLLLLSMLLVSCIDSHGMELG